MAPSEKDEPAAERALARTGSLLEIDLDAIIGNWRRLGQRLGPGASCAGVVKADAYGLGMARVAPALFAAGCRLFFVATPDEGLALRRLLGDAEIAVLNGLLPGTEGDFRRARLIPVLNDLGQVAAWRARAQTRALPAMLHIDTGMGRLGLAPNETARLVAEPSRLAGLTLRAVISHLACAEEAANALNAEQLARFRAPLAHLPGAPASLAASAGIFLG